MTKLNDLFGHLDNNKMKLLVEGIQEVKKYYPDIPDDKFIELIKLDPTYKGDDRLGKAGKWILNLYKNKLLKDEDFYKVTDYLTTFFNHFRELPQEQRDIGKYKSLGELANVIVNYEDKEVIPTKNEIERNIKKEAEKLYEDDNWLVIVPKTMQASQYYGANTKWCTAARDERNAFDDYFADDPINRLYININKKTGKKYQFHFYSGQFMDEMDYPLDNNTFMGDKLKTWYFSNIIADILPPFYNDVHTYDLNTNEFGDKRVFLQVDLDFMCQQLFDYNFSEERFLIRNKNMNNKPFLTGKFFYELFTGFITESDWNMLFSNFIEMFEDELKSSLDIDDLYDTITKNEDIIINTKRYLRDEVFNKAEAIIKKQIPMFDYSDVVETYGYMWEYDFDLDAYKEDCMSFWFEANEFPYAINEEDQDLSSGASYWYHYIEDNFNHEQIATDVLQLSKELCNKLYSIIYQEIVGGGKNQLSFNYEDEKQKSLFNEALNNIFLNEGVEEIKKYFPKIPEEDISKLLKLDPTYKGGNELGTYSKWILRLYNTFIKDQIAHKKWEEQIAQGKAYPEPEKKSQERIEDFDKIPNLLNKLVAINKNNIANGQKQVDINQFQSTNDLYSFITNTLNSGVSENTKVNHAIKLIKESVSKGGKVVFKDNNWIVLIPETLESSVVFGEDTNWCTTAANGERYYGYMEDYGGKYYINVDLRTGDLYQFHFESNQFMNSEDKQIEFIKFFKQNPDLFDFYKKTIGVSLLGKSEYGIIFVDNPSEADKLEAVKRNGNAIRYIENPSEAIQLEAVKQDGTKITYIENPSEAVKLAAVKQCGCAIYFIENPSEAVQLEAVKQYPYAIISIKNPSEEVKLVAVKQDGDAIEYIKNPSEAIQLEAVKQNDHAIRYIKNPSEEVQLEAVKQDGDVIRYIKNPSEEVQLEAVKQYPYVIRYIKNPTEKVKKLAVKLKKEQMSESVIKEEKAVVTNKTNNEIELNNSTVLHKNVVNQFLGDKAFNNLQVGQEVEIGDYHEPTSENIKDYKLNDNFWKWFGNSKVVDEEGKPIICYHGGPEAIKVFDKGHSGFNTANNETEVFFFTSDEGVAEDYSVEAQARIGDNGMWNNGLEMDYSYDDYMEQIRDMARRNVHTNPCFISMENPIIWDNNYNDYSYKLIYTLTSIAQGKWDYNSEFWDSRVEEEILDRYTTTNEDGDTDYSELENTTFDGVIIKNIHDSISNEGSSNVFTTEYLVWNPNQIKSVYNKGIWNLYNDDVMENTTLTEDLSSTSLKRRKIPTFVNRTEEQTRDGLKKILNKTQKGVFFDYYDKGYSLDKLVKKYKIEPEKIKSFIITLRKKILKYDPDKPQNPNIDPKTGRFVKGATAWNKGKYGFMGANKTSFTKADVKPAAIGVPKQGHGHMVTTSDETRPTKSVNGKIYNNHKRVSYPRWLLKQQGIEVPDDCVVWHKDGDYTNNNLDNLEVITRREAALRTVEMRKK